MLHYVKYDKNSVDATSKAQQDNEKDFIGNLRKQDDEEYLKGGCKADDFKADPCLNSRYKIIKFNLKNNSSYILKASLKSS